MIIPNTTYKAESQQYESNFSHSRCEPNQSYTPKELIIRYNCGTMPNIKRTPTWDNNPDINNPNPLNNPNLDLVDLENLRNKNVQRINDLQNPKSEEKTVPNADNPTTSPEVQE